VTVESQTIPTFRLRTRSRGACASVKNFRSSNGVIITERKQTGRCAHKMEGLVNGGRTGTSCRGKDEPVSRDSTYSEFSFAAHEPLLPAVLLAFTEL
jgi:hypothetical protein